MRILVVEDDEAIAGLLKVLLEKRGHQVEVFIDPERCPYQGNNGCTCPSATTCTDAIIVDYQLPRMTGLELLLRQEQAGCCVPSANKAISSALISDERKTEIETHGFTALRKPFEIALLDDFLAKCEARLPLVD